MQTSLGRLTSERFTQKRSTNLRPTSTPQEFIASPGRRHGPIFFTLAPGQIGIFRIGVDRRKGARLRKLRVSGTLLINKFLKLVERGSRVVDASRIRTAKDARPQ